MPLCIGWPRPGTCCWWLMGSEKPLMSCLSLYRGQTGSQTLHYDLLTWTDQTRPPVPRVLLLTYTHPVTGTSTLLRCYTQTLLLSTCDQYANIWCQPRDLFTLTVSFRLVHDLKRQTWKPFNEGNSLG